MAMQSLISICAHIGIYSRRGDRVRPRANEVLGAKRDRNDRASNDY